MDCLSLTIATREIARLVDDLPVPLYTSNSNSFGDLCSCSPVRALIATRPDGQKSWISPRIGRFFPKTEMEKLGVHLHLEDLVTKTPNDQYPGGDFEACDGYVEWCKHPTGAFNLWLILVALCFASPQPCSEHVKIHGARETVSSRVLQRWEIP